MPDSTHILAIDQGTTSSRAMVFDARGRSLHTSQREFRQIFPRPGWVEHDPEEIWETTLAVCAEAIRASAAQGGTLAAIGITNQRETTLIWDRKTGKPVHNAIVWQDRRTAPECERLSAAGHGQRVTSKTGLLIDPYFSGTKVAWILNNVDGVRERAERGELAFGTVDSFLLWRLTDGAVHATDATNASRTMLYNIHDNVWDQDLLDLLDIPKSMLPEVKDCAAEFGTSAPGVLGVTLPVAGIAGDQQAAAIGQACFSKGMIKSTYGTGCFVILNTGNEPLRSDNQLLTTICYRIGGETTYALEGSIFIAGAAVQWLRDSLGLIKSAAETEALAAGLADNQGVYLVPAFTGLGAPHWDPNARGAVFGITRDTGPAVLARATLESVCYETRDLFEAMAEDGVRPATLRVDGGMVANDWLLQFLADVLDTPVERPVEIETTAVGAALLAGLQIGVFESLDEIGKGWHLDNRFEPGMDAERRKSLLSGWDRAIGRVKSGA